ncbi:MAG: hypothetical protein RMJ28_04705 [Nitrososphaerota archaeon]|nr:hypothetical protein [Candidatus Calditenuaceae archaeon]MDW8073520.1 hypothetical protein [Nitrososphaerota archaeon]
MEDEDITLKLLKLRKLRMRMAQMAKVREAPEPEEKHAAEPDPVEELKKHISERGDEVLNVASSENPELVKRVSAALLKAIAAGRLETPIDAGDLLTLFRRLGLKVPVESRVMVHRKGETKDLRKALEENWRGA